ncbi:hypothetical protein EMCG_00484 [[Emmonsia] crescens]|uniref:C2H2-type domain-containing protein n=1 Tax=[Emmonsia] crescens TaxID=73230 RepID=A0A0G2HUS5_9EURO|nr:hypothetical protein EMCG_00484 [Emmonsia crescens UAMH 3008]
MVFRGGEDDPRLPESDQDSSYDDGCFSDAQNTQTDYSSVSGDDDDTNTGADSDISDKEDSDDDGEWLQNEEEEHPPEYYMQLEASLDPSTLRQLHYSPNMQARLDWVKEHWERYCSYVGCSIIEAYNNIDIRTLYLFLSWVCDHCQGKNGSSLQTFWKWFQMVYKAGAGKRIDQEIIIKSQDLLRLIVKEKDLRDLELMLVRDTMYERPCLVVKVTFDYMKRFLGKKPSDVFTLPEIIYDSSLILSPHVFLLGMLFHFQAFKDLNIRSPERLYDLGVLEGLNRQELLLRDELRDKFLFCEAICEGETVKLLQTVKGGELTGFEQMVKPYVLCNGAANKLNENLDVSDLLQNQILKHSNISIFAKHYQNCNVTLNTYWNYRGLDSKADNYLNLNLMSLFVDSCWLWKLTTKELINKLKRKHDAMVPGKKCDALEDWCINAQKRLNNDKQQARVKLKRQKLERYNEGQPVIDSKCQFAGLIVDEGVKSVLEWMEYMTPEMMILIDALLTLPGDSWDAEQQRRIKAINAITSYCGVQEGSLRQYRSPDARHKMVQDRGNTRPPINKPQVPAIEEAIRSVLIKSSEGPKKDKRPTMCFLCLQNEKLKLQERIHSYHEGSITKHFERKHLKDFKTLDCNICKVTLDTLKDLLIHAEAVHGTVTRNPKYLDL